MQGMQEGSRGLRMCSLVFRMVGNEREAKLKGFSSRKPRKSGQVSAIWPLPVRPLVWPGLTGATESCQLRFGTIQFGFGLILGWVCGSNRVLNWAWA